MQFWIKIRNKDCALCGKKDFCANHLLSECKVVRSWERHLDSTDTEPSRRRCARKKSLLSISPDHIFSWIVSWSIWKCYWEIVYKQFDNSDKFDAQLARFGRILSDHEYDHLKLVQIKRKNAKNSKTSLQVANFRYYKWDNGKIMATARPLVAAKVPTRV